MTDNALPESAKPRWLEINRQLWLLTTERAFLEQPFSGAPPPLPRMIQMVMDTQTQRYDRPNVPPIAAGLTAGELANLIAARWKVQCSSSQITAQIRKMEKERTITKVGKGLYGSAGKT